MKKVWFAASDDIARMGPFETDVEAWKALERKHTYDDRSVHIEGAHVWPEQAPVRTIRITKVKR